jgi:hypothetical protein
LATTVTTPVCIRSQDVRYSGSQSQGTRPKILIGRFLLSTIQKGRKAMINWCAANWIHLTLCGVSAVVAVYITVNVVVAALAIAAVLFTMGRTK